MSFLESTLCHVVPWKASKAYSVACSGSEWVFFSWEQRSSLPAFRNQNNVSNNFKLGKVAFRYHCLLLWSNVHLESLPSNGSPGISWVFTLQIAFGKHLCACLHSPVSWRMSLFSGYCRLLQNKGWFCTFQWVLVFNIILQLFKIKNRGFPFHALRFISGPLKLRGRTVCQNHSRLHVSIHLSNLKFIKGKLLSFVSS